MSPSLAELADRLPALAPSDERRIRRGLTAARKLRDYGARHQAITRLATQVERAEARLEARRAAVPLISYPPELPISERREEISEAIRDHQVVIVAGETGSGKTTQIPKICLELGRGVRGVIGHTQPRRIAARSVAERIAEETATDLGAAVGYTVRFTDRSRDTTLVKVMTDGILLAELRRDRDLLRYDTLIIDEAHERSLNIDFLLGYLHQLLPRRPDLKVVITSATIDTERFAAHFGGAPIVEVSGRTYPVEIRYEPIDEDDDDRDQIQAICDAVEELIAEGPGDILVFLSGEREIRDTGEALARLELSNTEVIPLFARLSSAEQHRVFAPHDGRRVVLATNVAETSLTVPGIRYVVDPGTARISRFNRRTKVQRLPIEAVSQASANQRAGRCGRVAPGICIRLYAEEDFDSRPPFTDPEILRTNLASVILQMAMLELGDVSAFPFIDPPDPRTVTDGVVLLEELGALAPGGGLTPVGRKLALLPIDPRLGRMVIEAADRGCLSDTLVVVAGLSIQDPRERPVEHREEAAALHSRFADPSSDFVALLNLWAYLGRQQEELSSNQFRRRCRAEHLNYLRVREWQDLHSQLRQVVRELRLVDAPLPADRDQLHMSILAGLLSHVGLRDPAKQDYQGARNGRFALAPGSALTKKPTKWVMAAELVETNRAWGRIAAPVEPAWVEKLSEHVATRSYRDPHWDERRGAVVATERVTVFGLPVVSGRRVDYGRIDPRLSRDLLIDHALVHGEWHADHGFVRRNVETVARVRRLEDRMRRGDLLVGEEVVFGFFDARVPATVTSVRQFDDWWAKARRVTPDLLDFTIDLLVEDHDGDVDPGGFPDVWVQGNVELPLRYTFDPGSDNDGVAVEIPVAILNQISTVGFDWHIPGLRLELVTALIRSLPKPVRRQFIPAPDYAASFLERSNPADGPLLERLEWELPLMTGDPLPPGSWDPDRLAPHLRMHFHAMADDGSLLASSLDLGDLRRSLQPDMRAAMSAAAGALERTGMRNWDIGELPKSAEFVRAGHRVIGYPALVDEGDTVGVRVLEDERLRDRAMWAGTRRLVMLCCPLPAKTLQRGLANSARLALGRSRRIGVKELLDDCTAAAVDRLIEAAGGPAWDEVAFAHLRNEVRPQLTDTAVAVLTFASRIVEKAANIEDAVGRLRSPAVIHAVTDIGTQVDRLVYPGFASGVGARRLPDILRYLRAIESRMEKLPGDPVRDRQRMIQVHELASSYEAAVRTGRVTESDIEIRWMLEELRVSLFAQALGTPRPVSPERIRRALAGIG
ncbi:MAG: ATP-dependent RNA helicase HrpA [Acidimicrobiales bacterium]